MIIYYLYDCILDRVFAENMFIQAKAAANRLVQTEQVSNYTLTTKNTKEATVGPSSECGDNSLILYDDFCTDNLTLSRIQTAKAAINSLEQTEQVLKYTLTTKNTNKEATAGPSSECGDNSLISHDDSCTDSLTEENNETIDNNDEDHNDDKYSNAWYNWTYEQTLLLIESYGIHEEEKSHPKQRKYMWDNIANDMISHGHDVDKKLCYSKWTNLLRSYKSAKDQVHGKKKLEKPLQNLFFMMLWMNF
ncbi:uncharacterized protein LOC105828634 [Monomorium pharaonis]|uniref:uncharacterized protein LOC105828634 n=1 Tax=Monomorium pharaonis TaxID=307658 RepID=UPI001747BF30|nr:uncharacterized protein LOC105828634 [Monomorium pharaonis]